MKLTKKMIHSMELIADIGARNASEYLTTMSHKKVKVSIPWISSYEYEKIPLTAGKKHQLVTAVFMQMQGDLQGVILMIFSESDALQLANLLMDEKRERLDEDGESALKEAAGNILANAYLNAFSDKLHVRITDSIPHLTTDMLASVLDGVLGSFAAKSETTIVFKNRFKIGQTELLGNAYIFFDPDSFALLGKKIRNYKEFPG